MDEEREPDEDERESDEEERESEEEECESDEEERGRLPDGVVDEAERLTRLARQAVDDAEAEAYRRERESLVGDHGYTARVREDDERAVLVCHPAAWVEGGTVQVERVEDVDRGVERPLSGPGDAEAWEAIAEHNRELAATVAATHGAPHGETAAALADFASNHYAKEVERLTAGELAEFRTEYFPRNAWPTDRQRRRLDATVELVFAAADAEVPASGGGGSD